MTDVRSAPTVVTLPRVCGSRATARGLVCTTVPAVRSGVDVQVDAHACALVAQGFADELVREVLCERRARSLVVTGGPERFAGWLRVSAQLRGVDALLVITLPAGEE